MSAPLPGRRSGRALKRVGHGGAGAVVAGNTLESFDAALEIGIDMIEFDVRERHGRMVVAHTPLDARRHPPTLERALAHVAQPRFSAVELNVDVKQRGCEEAILDALRRFGLRERALLSSQSPAIIDRVREIAPEVRVGLSVGGRLARARQRWGDWRATVLDALASGRWDALMLHHPLVERDLVERVAATGAELYAWTVDERERIGRLAELGVGAVTTNDPRLFAAAT